MRHRTAVLVLFGAGLLAGQGKTIGSVEFFAFEGVDTAALRESLPVRAGQPFSAMAVEETKRRIREAVLGGLGRAPSDVALVCCDDSGNWVVFIGLSPDARSYRAEPKGAVRLPTELLRLEKRMMAAWMDAVQRGAAGEDRSQGYALGSDSRLRAEQQQLRSLALRLEEKLFAVLAGSADAEHRAIAANALGYARQSPRQLRALMDAAGDSSSGVRNNAVRALGVLLEAKPKLRAVVPVRLFTDLVRSGIWTDRNKGAYVLMELTASHDRALLNEIAAAALPALREMAQWQSSGHAAAARTLLERIATP
ncbi:MAG: HEAT repeat domain-containing protein [Bryobacterales bacterium]|nr:HEAT repeat domain-containing protein [Bryobacterales bacterium]